MSRSAPFAGAFYLLRRHGILQRWGGAGRQTAGAAVAAPGLLRAPHPAPVEAGGASSGSGGGASSSGGGQRRRRSIGAGPLRRRQRRSVAVMLRCAPIRGRRRRPLLGVLLEVVTVRWVAVLAAEAVCLGRRIQLLPVRGVALARASTGPERGGPSGGDCSNLATLSSAEKAVPRWGRSVGAAAVVHADRRGARRRCETASHDRRRVQLPRANSRASTCRRLQYTAPHQPASNKRILFGEYSLAAKPCKG